MSHRSLLRITPCFAVALALAAVTRPAAAQDSRVFIAGGDRIVVNASMALPIADDVLRKLIETHLPDALLNDGADGHHVSITLDANDQYVSGQVTKISARSATSPEAGGVHTFVVGDTTGDNPAVVTIRRTGDGSAIAGSSSVSVMHARVGGEGAMAMGMGAMGSDHDMTNVTSVGFKRFAAGDFTTTPLIVTVIKLK
jgi:hypothetical protein